MSQEILVGPERRRRWADAQKIAIVGKRRLSSLRELG